MPETHPVFTIGHSTRAVGELVALLHENRIDLLVDIRTVPRSRTNPQFNMDSLPAALAAAGIGYCHIARLGGLRHRPKGAPPSRNTLWRNEAFRNYADYAATDAFRTGLDELGGLAKDHRCAIMCAEAVWWRCHRRIVADYLLQRGCSVLHLMTRGKVEAARLTPGAKPQADGTIAYAAEASSLFELEP